MKTWVKSPPVSSTQLLSRFRTNTFKYWKTCWNNVHKLYWLSVNQVKFSLFIISRPTSVVRNWFANHSVQRAREKLADSWCLFFLAPLVLYRKHFLPCWDGKTYANEDGDGGTLSDPTSGLSEHYHSHSRLLSHSHNASREHFLPTFL